MARIPREPEIEETLITDPSQPDESDSIVEMLESIAGEKSDRFKLYLHRASEKNPAVAAAYLNKYPPETSIEQIFEEAQTKYKGGNFVLVAREGGKIFKKAAFSAEYDREKDVEPPSVKASQNIDEAFDRISRSVEKSVLLDKVQEVTRGKSGDMNMTQLLIAMQQNQTEMMKLILPLLIGKKEERSTFSDLREMAVFLKNFQEGKIDAEGETSLTDSLVKALPAIAEAFARKGQTQPVPGRAALPPPPGPGSAGPIPPPATEIPDANKHPMAIAFNRVMAEIKFSLTLPETEKLYAHLLDYTENYMPGSIGEMLAQSEDDYVKWIMQFDSSFPAREQFFRNVYKFAVKDNQESQTGGEE